MRKLDVTLCGGFEEKIWISFEYLPYHREKTIAYLKQKYVVETISDSFSQGILDVLIRKDYI